jgi:hypothetical protein
MCAIRVLVSCRDSSYLFAGLDAHSAVVVVQSARAQIMTEFKEAEKILKPKISEMFEDVFDELPENLKEQVG